MSVKFLDNDAFYGFRVRRTVDGNLFQEYFSLKKGGKRISGPARKRVEAKAHKRDKALASQQVEARRAKKAERCFNANGTVRGVSYLFKREKSGTKTPIFQVGIASETDGKIICTSYSINAHGKELAWSKAIATFAAHKGIARGSKLYKKLLAAMPRRVAAKSKPAVKKKLASELPGKKAKNAAKKAAKNAAKKAAKKSVGKPAKKSSKKSVGEAAKKATKKNAKKSGKKTTKRVTKRTAKKPANKTAKKASRKTVAKKKTAGKTSKKRGGTHKK